MKRYETIIVRETEGIVWITFDRIEQENSIGRALLVELNEALDWVERETESRIVVLQGQEGFFSTGMDFREIVENLGDVREFLNLYLRTLMRLTTMPKIVIANIQGKALAGGVGFVAASDFAIATERSQFALPEVLWGLIPAIVMPFLIRRVGNHEAYKMALTSLPVTAGQAQEMKLIDEVRANPEGSIQRMALRLTRLAPTGIAAMKRYYQVMAPLEMGEIAVAETERLLMSPEVRRNLEQYVLYGRLPWETDESR